ncbi:MAG: alpha/beta fold hydrolase [Alphaproteobacteria bacterium]|nr:alpha/beta fold hydrolase [Alphaproteobacteria bacterium]
MHGADYPVWTRDGRDWPNRDASDFITAGGLRWHVQRLGTGPALLLLHGTGLATHSWRALLPLLAEQFMVVAPDLPGHGFTEAPPASRMSLPGMARLVGSLLQELDITPVLAAGHSAGAAIAAQMILSGQMAPRGLISLNGAMLPLRGPPSHLFAPLAKVIAGCSLFPRLFAWHASDGSVVERLIRNTGSTIEPSGIEFHRRLTESPGHVAAALSMMANWDLRQLERDLPRLDAPLLLIAGKGDRAIPLQDAYRVRLLASQATVVELPRLGHLAHEEQPLLIAGYIIDFARRLGVLSEDRQPRVSL